MKMDAKKGEEAKTAASAFFETAKQLQKSGISPQAITDGLFVLAINGALRGMPREAVADWLEKVAQQIRDGNNFPKQPEARN